MTTQEVKTLLKALNFPKRYITDQTAICILALNDDKPRSGLLAGHKSLSEGARIHDILNYARHTLGKSVAENTRESYRKDSLKPLMVCGLVVRHQLSTNDPNTYYRLHQDFSRLLSETDDKERVRLIKQLGVPEYTTKRQRVQRGISKEVTVIINSDTSRLLSPGDHNILEKALVEIFAPAFLNTPQVVYVGDTSPRQGYQNRHLMRRLNLPLDISASLPDVILYSEPDHHLVVVEAVTSGGPINLIRLRQLQHLTTGATKLGNHVSYVSAFPSRSVFRRFVEEIAWGSSVWIENEPNNIVHFKTLRKES